MALQLNCNCKREASTEYCGPVLIREDDGEDLEISIRRRMETIPISHCISNIPEKLRGNNSEIYSSKAVSIGPSHHGNSNLMAMEDHKWRYLHEILNRRPRISETLGDCIKSLRELELRARNTYIDVERLIHMGSREFLTMLLIDGCFIIELFLKIGISSSKLRDDPLVNTPGKLSILRRDLILLENQIPFFVLQRLFYILPVPKQCNRTITGLALLFFKNIIPAGAEDLQGKFRREGCHLLDLVRSCYLPDSPLMPGLRGHVWNSMRNAVELKAVGIRVRGAADAANIFDVKFEHGVLWVPRVVVGSLMEVVVGNMIAWEQCCGEGAIQFASSYALLMRSVVRCGNDAKLLCRRGVFGCSEGQAKGEIHELFARLCSGVEVRESCYCQVYQQLSEYRRPKCWSLLLNGC